MQILSIFPQLQAVKQSGPVFLGLPCMYFYGIRYRWLISFGALTLLIERQEGHPACKKLGVGLLMVMSGLELCTSYSSACHHHLRHPQLQ